MAGYLLGFSAITGLLALCKRRSFYRILYRLLFHDSLVLHYVCQTPFFWLTCNISAFLHPFVFVARFALFAGPTFRAQLLWTSFFRDTDVARRWEIVRRRYGGLMVTGGLLCVSSIGFWMWFVCFGQRALSACEQEFNGGIGEKNTAEGERVWIAQPNGIN